VGLGVGLDGAGDVDVPPPEPVDPVEPAGGLLLAVEVGARVGVRLGVGLALAAARCRYLCLVWCCVAVGAPGFAGGM
jgi:hypothetical protein